MSDIKLDNNLVIKCASLLSANEFLLLKPEQKAYVKWWWLKDEGLDGRSVAFVGLNGLSDVYGRDPSVSGGAVRPKLVIDNLKNTDLDIGSTFIFKDKEFEVVNETIAFIKTDIGVTYFDDRTSKYQSSRIKRFIENWFNN